VLSREARSKGVQAHVTTFLGYLISIGHITGEIGLVLAAAGRPLIREWRHVGVGRSLTALHTEVVHHKACDQECSTLLCLYKQSKHEYLRTLLGRANQEEMPLVLHDIDQAGRVRCPRPPTTPEDILETGGRISRLREAALLPDEMLALASWLTFG